MAANSSRFLSSYNKIDKLLRNIYNFKSNMTFTDVIRKSAVNSSIIRKYEDELIDYSRLRNAIVHNSNDKMVIAEPHTDIVEHIEHIERILSCPPRAEKVAHKAVTVNYDATLAATIKLMAASDFSNMPVVKDGKIIGVTNNKLIIEYLAKFLNTGTEKMVWHLENDFISSTLTQYSDHYTIMNCDATIDEVLGKFSSMAKLSFIILTSNGLNSDSITGVLTTGDIITMNKIMADY